jgi:hypothetical protein
LEKSGLLKKSDEISVVNYIPIRYAYVRYDTARISAVSAILQWLVEKARCTSIGRYGAWKYSFMEEAILDGKKTAEGLLSSL